MNKKEKNDKIKKQITFRRALKELKEQTGIDHYKLIMGDKKEKKKMKFKQYQDKMKEDKRENFD